MQKVEDLIPLQSLIDVANNYMTGEWSQEQLREYGDRMIIRGYIPLIEKSIIIMSILTVYEYADTEVEELQIADLYKNIFFYILLNGYAMVDCSDTKLLTYDNYDLLYPLFAPFIMSLCLDDYNVIIKMLHDTINFYNIKNLVEVSSSINIEAMNKNTKENKQMIEDLSKDKKLIEALKDIMIANDQLTTSVVENIKKEALGKVKEEG